AAASQLRGPVDRGAAYRVRGGAGRGRGAVSAEPGPPSSGVGGTPYRRAGPLPLWGMARMARKVEGLARHVAEVSSCAAQTGRSSSRGPQDSWESLMSDP